MSRRDARRATQQFCCGAAREGFQWGATTEIPGSRFTSNTLLVCLAPENPSMNQWFHLSSTSVLRRGFAVAAESPLNSDYPELPATALIEGPRLA